MHFMAGDAGKLAPAKTRRGLHAIEFSARHSNHSIAPKPIAEKIGLGPANEILLLAVILRIRLHNETLSQIVFSGTEAGALPIEIDFVRHTIESPNAVALAAIERRVRRFQSGGIRYARVGPRCEMKLETPEGIAIQRDVLGPFAVARLACNPEFRDSRVPPVTFNKTRLALRNMAVHARTVPGPD